MPRPQYTILLLVFVIQHAWSQKPASESAAADKAAFESLCGSCHATSMAEGLRSEPEWIETIDQMIKIGAKGTDEQFNRVLRHLLRTQTKVNVNAATAEQIAPVLDIPLAVAEAVVKRRAEAGPFQNLEDLKKVPGIDAAKLDARKDRIVL